MGLVGFDVSYKEVKGIVVQWEVSWALSMFHHSDWSVLIVDGYMRCGFPDALRDFLLVLHIISQMWNKWDQSGVQYVDNW